MPLRAPLGDSALSGTMPRIALAWLAAATLMLVIGARAILHQQFFDPDDTLRLVQVRDLLAGQSWFDLHQYRIDPADGGILMHWSRLVDLPIAAVIIVLRPLLGEANAEAAALVLVPLVTLFVLLALIGRLAEHLLGRRSGVVACLIAAAAVPIVVQVLPRRIDHHAWQIVAAVAALNGLMARNSRAGGWVAGLALACGIAISVEGLPLALSFAAIGAWRWWRGDGSDGLTRTLAGLAIGSLALFAATRGAADLAEHCDAVAPVHLALFAFAALAVGVLAALRPSRLALLAGLALIGAGGLAIVLSMAPQCTRGGFVALDPVVKHYWLDNVSEGQPIWRQGLGGALAIALPGLAGLVSAFALAARHAGAERRWWWDYAAALAATLLVAGGLARAAGTSCAFAAVPLAWAGGRGLAAARTARPGAKLALLAAMLAVVAPGFPAGLASGALALAGRPSPATAAPGRSNPAGQSDAGLLVADCAVAGAAPQLAALGHAQLLAPIDLGPALLLAAPNVTVLATGHHRGGPALRAALDAFTQAPDAARTIIRAKRITYVALCPGLNETALWAQIGPHGLIATMLAGHPPAWLAPLPPAPGSRLRLWRVVG